MALHTANFSPPTSAWDGLIYTELAPEFLPADDAPMMVQFNPAAYSLIRVQLHLNGVSPYAAVMYVGKLLILERSIDIGDDHVPINQARVTSVINGMSTSGQFNGRIVVGETRRTDAVFKWFNPDFYRASVDPFVQHAQEQPFFFAWHPSQYPEDVGYVWTTEDPRPGVDPVTQRVALTLKMQGIA